jgi:hypothetical protein
VRSTGLSSVLSTERSIPPLRILGEMSRRSVEIVRGNFEAWNRGDDELKAYVAEHLAQEA